MEKLYVHIIKRGEDFFELAGLSENKKLWYVLPIEHQDINEHKVLISKSTIRNAISAIKPINGYRKISVKLDAALKREYFDEDDNLCFKNSPLEEIVENVDCIENDKSQDENFLLNRIKELEIKQSKR